jgi:citrate lyase subunit beta/citryl-CoA lyase
MSVRPTPTTLLFVPGDRAERFDKAVASGADAVIIDLEDSVPPAAKTRARAAVASWLAHHRAYVRVNPARTGDFSDDVEMLGSAEGVAGLVLPKAEAPDDVDRLQEGVRSDAPIVALIESAAGLVGAAAIAAHPRVALLAFGNLDFAADCGMTVTGPEELELLSARSHLVHVSRAAGLPGPIEGVTADVSTDDAALRDSLRAVRLGFSGKLCVHPRQVPVVAGAFAPTAEQVAWAEQITASVTDGVALVDGAMVDRPVILRARNVLARAGLDQEQR